MDNAIRKEYDFSPERKFMANSLAESGASNVQALYDKVREAFLRSPIRPQHVSRYLKSIAGEIIVPKWFHDLLVEHPSLSAENLSDMISQAPGDSEIDPAIGASKNAWAIRDRSAIIKLIETWRKCGLTDSILFDVESAQGLPLHRMSLAARRTYLLDIE